jgi:hypothetical protein
MAPMELAKPEPPKMGQGNGQPVQVMKDYSSSMTVTQIIIIWVNNGGGATTQIMADAKSAYPPPAAAATHSVSF